jgi:hypothetical protein
METKIEYTEQAEEEEEQEQEDGRVMNTPVRVKQERVVMSAAQLAEVRYRFSLDVITGGLYMSVVLMMGSA